MTQANEWLYWQEALKGNFLEDLIQRGNPQSGFYRDRSKRAVAIWREDGGLKCVVTSGFAPRHADEIDELFGFVCRQPISRDLFMAIQRGCAWPEDVEAPRGMGDNSQVLPPHEALQAEINDLADAARDWLKSIGGKIVTQEQADKVANYATKFGDLEKRAVAEHKKEKEPFLEGGRKVDATWKPISALADEKKRAAKKLFEGWALEEDRKRRAEAARIAEEQRKAQEEARAAAAAVGAPEPIDEPPPPPPVVENVVAGTRGRVALRNKTEYVITDLPAFAAYLASLPPPPPDFIEACEKIARRMGAAGAVPPGVEKREGKVAA